MHLLVKEDIIRRCESHLNPFIYILLNIGRNGTDGLE